MTPRAHVLALLADSKQHPEEDGLRLILADWLEEYGDGSDQARAELIRCQIDHERLEDGHPDKASAGRRARWLQHKHSPDWLGPLAQWLGAWSFRRGLLSVSLDVSALRGQSLALLAASETWAWVDEIVLLGAADVDVSRLGRNPLLDGVTSLGFRRGTLGPAGMEVLGELPIAARLHGLDVSQCGFGDAGARELVRFPRLRQLDLSACDLTESSARLLAEGENELADLRSLVLWGNHLGSSGVQALTRSRRWPRLSRLDLRANQIDDSGGVALARWPGLAGVRQLTLGDNQLGPGTAFALAESEALAGVASLVLWGNPVGMEGARRLRERFGPRVHVSPALPG